MKKKGNWIKFPDGYSCDLNEIRCIPKVYSSEFACKITLRFKSCEKACYEWTFPFDKYIDSKEELMQKVEILREKLIVMANCDEEPIQVVKLIDLKKQKSETTTETES